MLQNRIAAATQVVAVPIVMATTAHPIALGFLRGPFSLMIGASYVVAAGWAFLRPTEIRPAAFTAGTGVTWLLLRVATLIVYGIEDATVPVPWAGVFLQLMTATFVGLFYWRSIVRGGFLSRVQWIEDGVRLG